MSLEADVALKQRRGFPRVSGDEPQRRRPIISLRGFSPRERG